MKQLFSALTAGAIVLMLGACSKSDYADKYADPSKISAASCDKLMTGVFFTGKTYTTPEYWRTFTFDFYLLGRCAQTVGFVNSTGRYAGGGEGYINDRWNHFYYTLAQYRLLEHTYNNLPDTERPEYEIFRVLAQIFIYEQLDEILALFGDVPFSKAGYLNISGDVKTAYPSYDKDEALYEMMLNDLAAINTMLDGYQLPTRAKKLPEQDYINKGDLTKWRKYANSLRLRMAMRLADNGALTAKAQAILKEMLADPAKYPVVDSNDENILIEADNSTDDFKVIGSSNVGIQGIESWSGLMNRASKAMIDALQNDDPRLEVIYDPNSDGSYVGIDTHDGETTQTNSLERPAKEGGIFYSAIDTSTFSRNPRFPGLLLSAAEVAFIKAEAFQKGYAQGSAKDAFVDAVKRSVDYYYRLNATGTYRKPIKAPSEADITAFAEQRWDAYPTKEQAIGTQKWLHFSLIDIIEAWNEVRRTGIPELYFQPDDGSPAYPNVFQRLRYPLDERTNNPEHYAKELAKDSYYRKLFWAKP